MPERTQDQGGDKDEVKQEMEIQEPIHLACELASSESRLREWILRRLLGNQARYGELKPLLGSKGDHNLTVALKSLRNHGLVRKKVAFREDGEVEVYEITPLGVSTALELARLAPVREVREEFLARVRQDLSDIVAEAVRDAVGGAPDTVPPEQTKRQVKVDPVYGMQPQHQAVEAEMYGSRRGRFAENIEDLVPR